MALYLIGDVQGCDSALQRLLDEISFSPSRDTLYLLGDLVNRGPDSAGVLRRLMGYGHAAQCVLGNHDLHLLALIHGIRPPHRKDTLSGVLTAPDRTGQVGLEEMLTLRNYAGLNHIFTQPPRIAAVYSAVVGGDDTVQTIAKTAQMPVMMVERTLMWLLKYDFVRRIT